MLDQAKKHSSLFCCEICGKGKKGLNLDTEKKIIFLNVDILWNLSDISIESLRNIYTYVLTVQFCVAYLYLASSPSTLKTRQNTVPESSATCWVNEREKVCKTQGKNALPNLTCKLSLNDTQRV